MTRRRLRRWSCIRWLCTRRPRGALSSIGLLLALGAGCVRPSEKLPPVAWNNPQQARQILVQRSQSIRTVTAQGDLTLQRRDGESVRFDLAMVRQGPDRLRIRAWKLGQAVFDLTLTSDGVWMVTPEEPSLRDKAKSAGLTARKFAGNLSMLGGDLFRREDLAIRQTPSSLVFESPRADDGTRVRSEVDRRTLVPQRYILLDRDGVAQFTLEQSDYRLIGDIPFAYRSLATSDQGRIVIVLWEVELNTELSPTAFIPPRRAEKLP